ncbi:MAG: hypothetical protein GXX79_20835 [Actinomycetales bacterium]|nr:hypothetical protein [Actinomycetales bacterium]
MLFFVKVRIDVDQLDDLGRQLGDGTLDHSALRSTYCHRYDPEVGLNIWEADDVTDFRRRFAPHRTFYRDLVEVTPVITPAEAMAALRESRSTGLG